MRPTCLQGAETHNKTVELPDTNCRATGTYKVFVLTNGAPTTHVVTKGLVGVDWPRRRRPKPS
jgi:hypothetical protein